MKQRMREEVTRRAQAPRESFVGGRCNRMDVGGYTVPRRRFHPPPRTRRSWPPFGKLALRTSDKTHFLEHRESTTLAQRLRYAALGLMPGDVLWPTLLFRMNS